MVTEHAALNDGELLTSYELFIESYRGEALGRMYNTVRQRS